MVAPASIERCIELFSHYVVHPKLRKHRMSTILPEYFFLIGKVCSVKDTIKRMSRQVTVWEKTFAITYLTEGLPSEDKKNTQHSTV